MRKLLAHCIEIYRPIQLDRLVQHADGLYPHHSCGPLRARVRFLRIPVSVLWACDLCKQVAL